MDKGMDMIISNTQGRLWQISQAELVLRVQIWAKKHGVFSHRAAAHMMSLQTLETVVRKDPRRSAVSEILKPPAWHQQSFHS